MDDNDLEAAAVLMSTATDDIGGFDLVRTAMGALPWANLLPPHAQSEFLDELLRTAKAGDFSGREAMVRLVRDWRETAAICADPVLFDQTTSLCRETVDACPRRP